MATATNEKTTKPSPNPAVIAKGHRNIAAGSRKEKIAMAFDNKGPEAALKKADELGVKATTVRSWFSAWRKVAAAAPTSAPARRRAAKKST